MGELLHALQAKRESSSRKDEREEERAVPRTGQQISALPDDGREGRAACQQAAHLKEKKMRTPPKNGRAPASTPKPPSKKKLLEGVDQATLCRAAAVSLALVAHLPSLFDGDVRDVLDPDYDSEESLIEALRTCAFGVDGGGCRRPASCLLTLLLQGSSTITKRLINVLLHGRVAWRAFDVALHNTQDHAAACGRWPDNLRAPFTCGGRELDGG